MGFKKLLQPSSNSLNTERWIHSFFGVFCLETWESVTIFQAAHLGYQSSSNSLNTEQWIF